MKVKYEFANETIEIEVSEEWGTLLLEMDREDKNHEQRETRRHVSLSNYGDQSAWLSTDTGPSFLQCADQRFAYDDQRFVQGYKSLTKKQKALFHDVYVKGYEIKKYAEKAGISVPAASQQNKRLKKVFKVFLMKP